jgi:hypothetical protein
MAITGGVLLYSALRDLSPWAEFQATLSTAKLPAAKAPGA